MGPNKLCLFLMQVTKYLKNFYSFWNLFKISFSFWYNMYGSGMGNLTVYLKSDEQILEEILRKSGNQSRGWNMDLIANLNVSTPFQVNTHNGWY